MKLMRRLDTGPRARAALGISVAICIAVMAGCSKTLPGNYDPDDPGRISGELMVFWDGYDRFIYYPYYRNPLTFHLPKELEGKLGTKTIRPGAIYTDGGSIPQALRNLTGLSPLGLWSGLYRPRLAFRGASLHRCRRGGQA